MKSLKEIIKKTERVSFSIEDTDFFGKYLMLLDKLKVTAMRPDNSLKDEGIIESHHECTKLGMFVWLDQISNMSLAFVKHKKKKKTISSLYVRDYEEDKTLWKNEGDYSNFFEATNWFNISISVTEPRIFEALKVAGLDKAD